MAADHGQLEVVRLLLGCGADPAIEHSVSHKTPLGIAWHRQHYEIVAILMMNDFASMLISFWKMRQSRATLKRSSLFMPY